MAFEDDFRLITGNDPLLWQVRLFKKLCINQVPGICDLPTGMGKTSVIHLWLLALKSQMDSGKARLPIRLVYVVDRRTVVDRATGIAEKLKDNLPLLGLSKEWLAISALRGQLADNREWTIDPSRPAVIIGTVDMIGSRLLFSGYRSSYKRRPLEAGLVGHDALLVLDEAHLSEPFAKLTRDIEARNSGPLKVMHMSATSAGGAGEDRFKLEPSDLAGDPTTNPVIRRYDAEKRLHIQEGVEQLDRVMATKAVELSKDHSRVVVFVRTPDLALKVAKAIRSQGDKKDQPFANSVEILTGTMRGLERDDLLKESPVMRRFLDPQNKPELGLAILVSTAAGEVGFDLNADHLVCDSAPLDSMIQRFGRVNRRGEGKANIHVFIEKSANTLKKKHTNTTTRRTYETASANALEILRKLNDVSPRQLDSLSRPVEALSPRPRTAEVTDILLDTWALTTICEPLPGRPAVASWLRGLGDDEPETAIAWRAELDLDGFDQLEVDDIEEWLDAHRILPHEVLSVPTRIAAKAIVERWRQLSDT